MIQRIERVEEGLRPFLIPTRNPGEIAATPDIERHDLRNLLSIILQSRSLWFRIEYTLGGIRSGISPYEFIEAAAKNEDERLKFIETTTHQLAESSKIVISIINPARLERVLKKSSSSLSRGRRTAGEERSI